MITYPSKSELKTASEVAVYFRNCSDGKQMESKWKANGKQMESKWKSNGKQMFLRSFFVVQMMVLSFFVITLK